MMSIFNGKTLWADERIVKYRDGLGETYNEEGAHCWYRNGKLHRDNDLPALETKNGSKYWYRDGKLHRDNDLPATTFKDGGKVWYRNGLRHRDKGPAMELDGKKWYCAHGKRNKVINV